MSTLETAVFLAVLGGRFLVPLLIPLWPLPALVAALVLDAVDQSVFQAFGYDPPGYQSYDKAMDVYYLAVAYLATLRNWSSPTAFSVGRFLYFYRLVGVVAFELTQLRALLLVFANTFEYFFIAHEGIRSRWSTARWGLGWWVRVAAVIWVVVKLPQEYWIHVAQLDFTDFVADHAWAAPTLVVALLVAAAAGWFLVRPRLLPADHPWRFRADPLPAAVATQAARSRLFAAGDVRSGATVEKVVLLGLLTVVFARSLPGVRATDLQLFVGAGAVVVVNAAVMLALARRDVTVERAALAVGARTLANVVLVLTARWLLTSEGGRLDLGPTLFFLTMISLLTTLHDRWRPVHDMHVALASGGNGGLTTRPARRRRAARPARGRPR